MNTTDRITVIGAAGSIVVMLAIGIWQDSRHGQAATERENIRNEFRSLHGNISDLRVQLGRVEQTLDDYSQRVRRAPRNEALEDCLADYFKAGVDAGMVSFSPEEYCRDVMP